MMYLVLRSHSIRRTGEILLRDVALVQFPGEEKFLAIVLMEEGRSAFKILTGKPTGKRPLERPGIDGRTIFEWTLKR